MYLYLLIGLVMVILIYKMIFKLLYPFESRMPVFFYHDILSYFKWGVIEKDLPVKNKFYDVKIKYLDVNDISDNVRLNIVNFLGRNYLPELNEKYIPTLENVFDYLTSHPGKSVISLMYELDDIIGCISHVPNLCLMDGDRFEINYVDYLCVDNAKRGKKLAGKLIHTHYVNTRYNKIGSNYAISYFKYEGHTAPYMPIIRYNTYFYDMTYWTKEIKMTQSYYKIVRLNEENYHYLFELFKTMKDRFKLILMSDLLHIKHLNEKNHMFVFILLMDDEPLNFYIFKDQYVKYNNKNSLLLTSSFKQSDNYMMLFGFYYSLTILLKYKNYVKLLIEDVSDNDCIIKHNKYHHFHKTIHSYHFYNYSHKPFKSNNVIIVN